MKKKTQYSIFNIQNPISAARRVRRVSLFGAGTPPCRVLHRSGFTLVEVLASMAVLIVLILALTRMFMEA